MCINNFTHQDLYKELFTLAKTEMPFHITRFICWPLLILIYGLWCREWGKEQGKKDERKFQDKSKT